MTNTQNYNLLMAEGSDAVNPLTQIFPNFQTIDTVMKANQDAGVTTAVETKSGTNHAIVRTHANGVFRFVATSNYAVGDTFTVDGQSVTATLPDGTALQDGAFVINAAIFFIGSETLISLTYGKQVISHIICAAIGLIPNCASSVALTGLAMSGVITVGAMMAGLFAGAGVGILILFRMNKRPRENALIVGLLVGIGVAFGIVADLIGFSIV